MSSSKRIISCNDIDKNDDQNKKNNETNDAEDATGSAQEKKEHEKLKDGRSREKEKIEQKNTCKLDRSNSLNTRRYDEVFDSDIICEKIIISDPPIPLSVGDTLSEICNNIVHAIETETLDDLKSNIKKLYEVYDKTLFSTNCKKHDIPIPTDTDLITLACKHNQHLILDFLLNQTDLLYYLPNETSCIKEAFCNTILSNNSKMLEMIYDYWSGEVHWLANSYNNIQIVTNLELLRLALKESIKTCESEHEMKADVQCLISFNNFQIALYKKLFSITTNELNNEINAIKAVFLYAYECYDEFTKEIDLPDYKNSLSQTGDISHNKNCHSYLVYNIYYRKMDFNIAVLILDNLYLLKQRLKMPNNAYQQIECTLYNFLNDKEEKIYLSKNELGYKSTINTVSNSRLQYVPILYLERKNLKIALASFINTLKVTNNERDPSKDKIPKEEINNLTLLPYLRDDYSLKKMLNYITAILRDKNTNYKANITPFIIQRVLQVVGEFMKNSKTGETCHLSATTKAILQTEIPKNIIKSINQIRDDFSHAKYGGLIKRIDIEINEPNVFEGLYNDLKEIGKAIKEIIELYRPILVKNRINSNIQLIKDWVSKYKKSNNDKEREEIKSMILNKNCLNMRMRKWTREEVVIKSIRNALKKLPKYKKNIEEAIAKINIGSMNDFTDDWDEIKGIFEFLVIEIDVFRLHKFSSRKLYLLENYWKSVLSEPDANGIASVRRFIEIKKYWQKKKLSKKIKQILLEIENHNNKWSTVQKDVGVLLKKNLVLKSYPNKECIDKIRKLLLDKDSNSIQQTLKELKDWSDDWNKVKNILEYIVIKKDVFKLHTFRQFTKPLEHYWKIVLGHPDVKGIASVTKLLSCTTDEATKYGQSQVLLFPDKEYTHDFKHITQITDIMKTPWFLTKAEIEFLLKNINFKCKKCAQTFNLCVHFYEIAKKIQNNKPLEGDEFKKLKSLNINEKCKKTVENLVMGRKRDSKMLECLVYRAKDLNCLLSNCRDKKQLVLRYKCDEWFRIAIEILISDIMNVFVDNKITNLSNVKFCKMLSGIPLRNILNHGNPYLEVIGSILDDNDVPSAIISFALYFIQNDLYLNDLLQLYEDGVNRDDVYSKNLKPHHEDLVKNFKKCVDWKIYINFLPPPPRK